MTNDGQLGLHNISLERVSAVSGLKVARVLDGTPSDRIKMANGEFLHKELILDSIVELNSELFQLLRCRGGLDFDPAKVRAGAETLLRNPAFGHYVLAWLDEDRLIGKLELKTCLFDVWQNRTYYYIDNFVVSRKYHRKGVGNLLLRIVANEATTNNCERIRLSVDLHNRNALDFYGHRGFESIGHLLELTTGQIVYSPVTDCIQADN